MDIERGNGSEDSAHRLTFTGSRVGCSRRQTIACCLMSSAVSSSKRVSFEPLLLFIRASAQIPHTVDAGSPSAISGDDSKAVGYLTRHRRQTVNPPRGSFPEFELTRHHPGASGSITRPEPFRRHAGRLSNRCDSPGATVIYFAAITYDPVPTATVGFPDGRNYAISQLVSQRRGC
jgi:hypothetical protein